MTRGALDELRLRCSDARVAMARASLGNELPLVWRWRDGNREAVELLRAAESVCACAPVSPLPRLLLESKKLEPNLGGCRAVTITFGGYTQLFDDLMCARLNKTWDGTWGPERPGFLGTLGHMALFVDVLSAA